MPWAFSLLIRILWSSVSNAFLRSMKMAVGVFFVCDLKVSSGVPI